MANVAEEEETAALKPNPWMRTKLSQMRRKAENSATDSSITAAVFDQHLRAEQSLVPDKKSAKRQTVTVSDEHSDEEIEEPSPLEEESGPEIERDVPAQTAEVSARKTRTTESPKKRKKAKRSVDAAPPPAIGSTENVDLDSLFDSLDKRLIEVTQQQIDLDEQPLKPKKKKPKKLKLLDQLAAKANARRGDADETLISEGLSRDGRADTDPASSKSLPTDGQAPNAASLQRAKKAHVRDPQAEIMANPKHFLHAETRPVVQVAADLVEQMDEFDDARKHVLVL